MDRLPEAFLPALRERIRFGARMTAIDQSPEGVTIHFRNLAGPGSIQGDFAILTVPTPVLRHVELLKPFSRAKSRAIRQLHYDASAKIFVQCRRRFWEEEDGIFGGGSVTDMAVRNI
jgi:monoamine oxidase